MQFLLFLLLIHDTSGTRNRPGLKQIISLLAIQDALVQEIQSILKRKKNNLLIQVFLK
jgi:DNA invertase Pin-like site-specific DNA recombinase